MGVDRIETAARDALVVYRILSEGGPNEELDKILNVSHAELQTLLAGMAALVRILVEKCDGEELITMLSERL